MHPPTRLSTTHFPSEIRIPVASCDGVKANLESHGAILKGSYAFEDTIYQASREELRDGYYRLRAYEDKGSWKECSDFEITEKRFKRDYKIATTVRFSTKAEAEKNLSDKRSRFSFTRTGCEYALDGLRIFVEQVDRLGPSVEIVAPIAAPQLPEEFIPTDDKKSLETEMLVGVAEKIQKDRIQKVMKVVSMIGLDFSSCYTDSLPIVFAAKTGL